MYIYIQIKSNFLNLYHSILHIHIPWKSTTTLKMLDPFGCLTTKKMLVRKATYKHLVITNFQGKVEISIDTLSIWTPKIYPPKKTS